MTGGQTCALPISEGADHGDRDRRRRADATNVQSTQVISSEKQKY